MKAVYIVKKHRELVTLSLRHGSQIFQCTQKLTFTEYSQHSRLLYPQIQSPTERGYSARPWQRWNPANCQWWARIFLSKSTLAASTFNVRNTVDIEWASGQLYGRLGYLPMQAGGPCMSPVFRCPLATFVQLLRRCSWN